MENKFEKLQVHWDNQERCITCTSQRWTIERELTEKNANKKTVEISRRRLEKQTFEMMRHRGAEACSDPIHYGVE